jgi:DNA-binding CsgD family transcriptional regulator
MLREQTALHWRQASSTVCHMTKEQLAQVLAANPPDLESGLEGLNDRELEVFSILSQGCDPRLVESEFGIALPEFNRLKQSIRQKLKLKTEAQLRQAAARHTSKSG